MFGVMRSQQVCSSCGGRGKIITEPCPDCGGAGRVKRQKTIKVKIPAGVDNNQMLTVNAEGNAGYNGAPNGNLIVVFRVLPHKLFVRSGYDLKLDLPIKVSQAILGGKVSILTISGDRIDIDIPEGTEDGTIIRVKRRGIKFLRKDTYGDLFIKIIIDLPKNLSIKQRKALKESMDVLENASYSKVDKFNKLTNN
jgi:molecular chaperone DnaJ